AAVFGGLVLILILKKKYYWALGISVFGLFIKEILIFLPFAAALSYVVLEKRDKKDPNYILAGAFLLLPVIIWLAVRLSFGFVFEGASYTEHFSSIKYFGVTIAQSILSWPLGIPDRIDVITNFKAATSMDFAAVSWFYLLASVFNLLMNAFIGYLVFRFIKDKQYLYTNKNFLVLIIWLIIFYAMLIILGLETRFGELYYLLLIPIVFCIIKAGVSSLLKKSLYVYLGFYLIFGVFGYFSILGSDNIGYYVAKFSRSKKLVDNLVTLNKANQRSVLVNDIAGGFGSQFLPEFIGTQKDLVKINSISFDDPDGLIGSGFSLVTPTDNDSVQLIVTLPDGVKFQFEGIDMKLFEHKERDWIKRTE